MEWTNVHQQPGRGRPSFLVRHWRGDLPLWQSYWINSVLLAVIVGRAVAWLGEWLSSHVGAREVSLGALASMAVITAISVWSSVGTWRAAGRTAEHGGSPGWGRLARAMIVLGAFLFAAQTLSGKLGLSEYLAVIRGDREPGPPPKVVRLPDGHSILFIGGLHEGSSAELKRVLQSAPAVKNLVLESPGGWLTEAKAIADLVRQRGLDTHVESSCLSACTIVMLAGRNRTAAGGAKIGFHRSRRLVGDKGKERDLDEIYKVSGVSQSFIARVNETPTDSIWYPDREELLESHVITGTSRSLQTTTISTVARSEEDLRRFLVKVPAFAALSERYPAMFDQIVQAIARQTSEGKTDAEITRAARGKLTQVMKKLLPSVPDDAIEQTWRISLEEAEVISKRSHEDCAILLGLLPGPTVNVAQYISDDLGNRDEQVTERMIRTADPFGRATNKVIEKELEWAMAPVRASLDRRQREFFHCLRKSAPRIRSSLVRRESRFCAQCSHFRRSSARSLCAAWRRNSELRPAASRQLNIAPVSWPLARAC